MNPNPLLQAGIVDEQLHLDGLSREAVTRLVEVLLGGAPANELVNLVMDRSEGNPYFVEQIIRYLQDENMIEMSSQGWKQVGYVRESFMPGDIGAVLVARLDQLSRRVRETVQTASVFGREFLLDVLEEMLAEEQAIEKYVMEAERYSIWIGQTDRRYIYTHGLLRDTAYSMQIRARRRELHALAVRALGRFTARSAGSIMPSWPPEALELADRAWVARVEPLELWLAGQLWVRPTATRQELLAASEAPRAEATAWLFKTSNKRAQDRRLRELRGRDAFVRIHARWARLGYPFDSLVASSATAIGTSADRPAALAELLGIVAAGGLRLPERRVASLAFARATPYETNFEPMAASAQRVLDADVVRTLRASLGDVVAHGTARRVASTFATPEGAAIPIAGKTATDDHRYKTFARGGAQTSEPVLNRSAVFAFMIGELHFGVVP